MSEKKIVFISSGFVFCFFLLGYCQHLKIRAYNGYLVVVVFFCLSLSSPISLTIYSQICLKGDDDKQQQQKTMAQILHHPNTNKDISLIKAKNIL